MEGGEWGLKRMDEVIGCRWKWVNGRRMRVGKGEGRDA
jgi:hypothetical protein